VPLFKHLINNTIQTKTACKICRSEPGKSTGKMLALGFHGACIAIGLALGAKDLQKFHSDPSSTALAWIQTQCTFLPAGEKKQKKDDTATKLF